MASHHARLARILLGTVCVAGCTHPGGGDPADTSGLDTGDPAGPLAIPLVWYPGGGDTSWEEARAGFWWALGNLGAAPPDESALVVEEVTTTGVTFTLDLGAVGLPEARLPDVSAALAPVREWAGEAPVDLGRFLMATLYEPGRYYAITGACATLEDWRAARQVPDPLLYAITVSLLVEGDRLVTLNPTSALDPTEVEQGLAGIGWLASEGEGSLADGTFSPREYETVDVMPNGFQRFAVYDAGGALRAAAAETTAGQPGKCMWCHELYSQRGTSANTGVEGYLSYDEFLVEVDAADDLLDAARERETAIGDDYVVHEWAERLSLSFLEPSAERVANEWGVTTEEVRAIGLPTHTHEEFPEWGELYERADVDAARMDREPGWAPLDTPPDDREIDPDRALSGAEALACSPGFGAR